MFKLEKFFKTTNSMSLKNMVGFTREMKLARMPNAKQIMDNFYSIRT
jgi:hypothetical protein